MKSPKQLKYLDFDGFNFVSDSQDTDAIKEMYPEAKEFDAFFVMVGKGEYLEIWGIEGTIPYLNKYAHKIL